MKYFLDIMEMIVAKSIHQKKYNIRLKECTNIDSISRKTESYYNLRDIQTFSSVDFSTTKVPIIQKLVHERVNINKELEKQPQEVLYKKSCSNKSRNIHRNTPVLETLFNKVAGFRTATLLKRDSSIGFFPVNIA